jgi:hypothetical protein
VADEELRRIEAMGGGGIALQDRMAFAGEYFVDRYGREAALRAAGAEDAGGGHPSARAPMVRASAATTPGPHCTGW